MSVLGHILYSWRGRLHSLGSSGSSKLKHTHFSFISELTSTVPQGGYGEYVYQVSLFYQRFIIGQLVKTCSVPLSTTTNTIIRLIVIRQQSSTAIKNSEHIFGLLISYRYYLHSVS